MARIDFYHLQRQKLEDVLPKLLQKAHSTGNKIKLKIGNEANVETLNSFLWTFNDESFIPHGSKKDGFAEQQPIWLSADDDNPNGASFLFLVDGAEMAVDTASAYERVFNIFDGNLPNALDQARQMWKNYKNAGFEIFYWQQNSGGAWEQKA